jgi:hypothetical protein
MGGSSGGIAEIAGAIAGRNVHAAAERDRKMREVAANASPLSEDFEKRSWGALACS